jgi:hypothetical protein
MKILGNSDTLRDRPLGHPGLRVTRTQHYCSLYERQQKC